MHVEAVRMLIKAVRRRPKRDGRDEESVFRGCESSLNSRQGLAHAVGELIDL
jgi:hypothetical protein